MRIQYIVIQLLFGVLLIFQNCAQKESLRLETVSEAALESVLTDDEPKTIDSTPPVEDPVLPPVVSYKSCLVDGVIKPHLWSELGFKNIVSNNLDTCDLIELRQCIDGHINPFSVGDPLDNGCHMPTPLSPGNAPCYVGNQVVPDSHVVILFKTELAAGDQNCVGEIRRCSNGTLTGSDEYSSPVCGESFYSPASGTSYDCEHNGVRVPDGAGIISFLEDVATVTSTNPNGVCIFEARRCLQGRLSGSKTNSSCRPKK